MIFKGLSLFALALLQFAVQAATPQVSDDLFDLHSGVIITAKSPAYDAGTFGMLGGTGFGAAEPNDTIFSEAPVGTVQFVEFRTPAAAVINRIHLFARGDNDTSVREFSKFTLKAKSIGSSTFDQTLYTWNPTVPFVQLHTTSWLVLDTAVTSAPATDFRAEFVVVNGGCRVMELDGFGSLANAPAGITTQPTSQSAFLGASAGFSVGVSGTAPITVEWQHEGTNVVTSDRITIVDGHDLAIANISADDAGTYRARVSNDFGPAVLSDPVTLTVKTDTNAPVVVITSPASGLSTKSKVTISGTITDDQSVASARWENNGVAGGAIALTSGAFTLPVTLLPGENRIKIIGVDAAGIQGSAEVSLTLPPAVQSDDDLWDLSKGTVVTAHSDVFAEASAGLLGGEGTSLEPGDTIFSDNQPNGFVHYYEWKTPGPVTVSSLRLFGSGDGPSVNNGREFGSFVLKTKSPGSTTFDVTVLQFTPQHPYAFVDAATQLVLETNFTAVTAQEFRGEFVQANLRTDGWNGPRIMELDAFGPSAGGAPQIVSQPQARAGFTGSSATFVVGAIGAGPLHYQWRHEGTNLVESSHVQGVNAWSLTVNNLKAEDAGAYSVVVSNSIDQATSADAALTVTVDSTAPVVTIASPLSGAQSSGTFTLAGTIQDEHGVASATWELNGRQIGTLRLTSGHFSLGAQTFDLGENDIKITATDLSGNVGTAEVVATWTVPRAFALGTPATVQEGSRVVIPVSLMSTGKVGSATLVIAFDTNYLADAQFEWSDALSSASTSVNLETLKQFRNSFALPGTALPSGTVSIGSLSFRARSVPTASLSTAIKLSLAGVYSDAGDPYTQNNYVQGASAVITRRKITGDVNANDRLDVGDASVILRLASRIEVPRTWDKTLNDLNKNFDVDSGDATKVLRAVVGLDPQPTLPAPAQLRAASVINVDPVQPPPPVYIHGLLVADKATGAAGDKVTVEVRISGQTKSIAGAFFKLTYPVDALRLENSTANLPGSMVPSGGANGAVVLWNVSPNQSNYATQDGTISFAASSPNAWASNNGTLAKFTFTVQAGASARYGWPVVLHGLELSRDGFQTEIVGDGVYTFTGKAAGDVSLKPTIGFNPSGSAHITLQGDIGASYQIDGSSDLKNWNNVGTVYSTNGTVDLNDSLAAGATMRFYRATLIPN
jgi:hypothetical protein